MKLENTNFTMTYTFYKNRIDQIRNRWAWMTVRVVHAFLSSIMYLHLHVFNWITSIYFIDYDKRID